jgi:hypothetical protein
MPKKKKGSKAKRGSAKKRFSVPKLTSKSSKVEANVARKKSAAPKKKLAQVRKPLFADEDVSPQLASVASTAGIAPQKACLPLPAAIKLVRSCCKAPDTLPLDTQLGVLIPSPTARNSFCQCVADGVPTDRSKIPCAASNTLQDVVDAIAC